MPCPGPIVAILASSGPEYLPHWPTSRPSFHAWSTKLDPHYLSLSIPWIPPRSQRNCNACLSHPPPAWGPPRAPHHPRMNSRPEWSGRHLIHLHAHFSPAALTSAFPSTWNVSNSPSWSFLLAIPSGLSQAFLLCPQLRITSHAVPWALFKDLLPAPLFIPALIPHTQKVWCHASVCSCNVPSPCLGQGRHHLSYYLMQRQHLAQTPACRMGTEQKWLPTNELFSSGVPSPQPRPQLHTDWSSSLTTLLKSLLTSNPVTFLQPSSPSVSP